MAGLNNDYTSDYVQKLLDKIDQLTATVDQLTATVSKLSAENAALKEQLNKNSNNSSKSPSSDGLNKSSRKSLRKPSGKKQLTMSPPNALDALTTVNAYPVGLLKNDMKLILL